MNNARAAALVRDALKSSVARERRYLLRSYQVDAGLAAYRVLRRNRSALLNLPTGTGKTLIGNLVSLFWHEIQPDARGLVIVPRRVLVSQHREMARWLAPRMQSFALDDTSRKHRQLRALALSANLLISTPELFVNVVEGHELPQEVLESIRYVIVDEFDEFLQFHYTEEGPAGLCDKVFDSLRRVVDGRPMLLMSATSPLECGVVGQSVVRTTLAEHIQEQFGPSLLKVNAKDYQRYLPTARIRVVGVHDPRVTILDLAIQTEKTRCFDDLIIEVGEPVDESYILSRLEGLLSGAVRHIRLLNQRRSVVVDAKLSQILARLRGIVNLFEFLFEDMFRGYAVERRRTRMLDRDSLEFSFQERYRLVRPRESPSGFWPEPRGKADFLIELLGVSKKKGVVFIRNLRLLDVLIGRVQESGFQTARLDGDMTDGERTAALSAFRSGSTRLLFITRETGKRGLDLPQADFAVFYSPKAREDTVWQEISRIRSNVNRTKDTFIVFYSGTSEERKLRSLVRQMDESGRGYRLVLPSGDWLSGLGKT